MSIAEFIASTNGLYRPNRFRVSIDFIDSKLEFLCRSTAIPENTIGKINIPYKGLNIPVAGDQTEKEWTLEVFADTDFTVRNELETWMELIRPQEVPGGTNVGAYVRTADIDLLDTNDNVIRSYKILRCFPTSLGEMALSMDSTDTIATYTTTFAISSFTSI